MSGPPDHHGRAAFRPLAEGDLPALARWFGEPHVLRWWHESPDLEAVRSKYLPRIGGEVPVRCLIGNWDDVPCAMFQHYLWTDFPGGLTDTVGALPSEAGIDYLIGIPELVGHGLGPQMIATFIDQVVLADPTVSAIRVDINAENIRSRRAVEKLGFGLVTGREFVDEGERYVVYRRDADRGSSGIGPAEHQ